MKIMSRDELERERYQTNFYLKELSDKVEEIKKSSLKYEPQRTFTNTLYLFIEQNKKVLDSHLAQSSQLSQAVELLGSINKALFPFDDLWDCPVCEGSWSDSHKKDCIFGKAQAFLKEVKG